MSEIIADSIPGRIQHETQKRMSLAKMAAYKDAAMTEVWGEQWQHEPGQHQWQQAGGTAAAHSHKDFAKSDVGIVATASSASFGAGCTTNSSLARKMEIMRIILHLEVLPQESRKSWDFGLSLTGKIFTFEKKKQSGWVVRWEDLLLQAKNVSEFPQILGNIFHKAHWKPRAFTFKVFHKDNTWLHCYLP